MPQRNTFRQLVANHFASRPTLRQVIATDGFAVLLDRYPWIATHNPGLKSLETFTLLGGEVDNNGLVDRLLQHLLTGERLSLVSQGPLSIAPPAVFRAQEQGLDATAQPQIDLDMSKLNSAFDTLLAGIRENLQQAQISYWNGFGESDVTRLRWPQQMIKASGWPLAPELLEPGADFHAPAEGGLVPPLVETLATGKTQADRWLDLYRGDWGGDLSRVYEESF